MVFGHLVLFLRSRLARGVDLVVLVMFSVAARPASASASLSDWRRLRARAFTLFSTAILSSSIALALRHWYLLCHS
jgi:hypothetical protein